MKIIFLFLFFLLLIESNAQLSDIPNNSVLTDDELIQLLDEGQSRHIAEIKELYSQGKNEDALKSLADFFKEKLKERYFFSHADFDKKFKLYNVLYQGSEKYHQNQASQHLELYPPVVEWTMPFVNLKGDTVTSYPYRHLTRQHKADDIALMYYYTNDRSFLNYIPAQAKSLNSAVEKNNYETVEEGNGVFESFRAGNRIFHWLFVNQVLLASEEYSWRQQITLIKHFLISGAKIAHHNTTYRQGNHQTRGMSALLMVSLAFQEFQGIQEWTSLAVDILEEHLNKEVYPDGFQFERTVHYHLSDIYNYLYAYQAAKNNELKLDDIWNKRIEGFFDVLVEIALPNKKAPVLQDDTDSPWAEFNEIGSVMNVGTAIFENPEYKYFSSELPSKEYFWLMSEEDLNKYEQTGEKEPKILSTKLGSVGYYIMREGWDEDDLYMIINAGLTQEKPDHQHADMLGVQAYAYGEMVLPNYQVRYFLSDLDEFKNSFVKNVAIVDSVPQGVKWKGNKGGSGFGKWLDLPNPKVNAWFSTNDLDFFQGSHDGYQEKGIDYLRQVFFLKDDFWMVRDFFNTENNNHSFHQIWQGHYSAESTVQLRSVFPSGVGLDIVQLQEVSDDVVYDIKRGKGRAIVKSLSMNMNAFTTILYPFSSFSQRLDFDNSDSQPQVIGSWIFKKDDDKNVASTFQKENSTLVFGLKSMDFDGLEIESTVGLADLFVEERDNVYRVYNCGSRIVSLIIEGGDYALKVGESISIEAR